MVSKIKVDEIESSQAGGDITFNTLPKIGGVSNFGRKNYIINGNFDIWQRGTSLTGQAPAKYLADRWRTEPSGATYNYEQGTFTVGQTDVPNNPKYFANFTITGADNNFRPEQRIEDVTTLAGETITISFWAKYTSNAPTTFNTTIRQYFGSGGSTEQYTVFASGQTLTTSWQKFELTGTVPSVSGKTIGSDNFLSISPFWNGNNETFDVQIAQVQVEKGSVATDFEYRPIGEELNLCARYYQKLISPRVNFNMAVAGIAETTSLLTTNIPLKNEMRIDSDGTVGTVTKSGDMAINDFASNGNNLSGTPINYFRLSNSQLSIGLNKATANLTQFNYYRLSLADDAYFDIDVEL